MLRVYLLNNEKIYITDKTEKKFKAKFGNMFEQVSVIKDMRNIYIVQDKLSKTYKKEVIIDIYRTRLFWGLVSEEKVKEIGKLISERHKGVPKSEEHRAKLSEAGKKYRNRAGKKHTEEAKARIGWKRRGIGTTTGRRWMYNPTTDEEKLGHTLIEGFYWGRSAGSRDVLRDALKEARRIKYL